MKTIRLIPLILLIACLTSSWAQLAPIISSFYPTSGSAGTSVTIYGNNFNPSVADNIVYFGAVKATVTSASSTQLSILVPAGTTFQPISVTNTAIGLTGYSAFSFALTFPGGGDITASSFAPKVDLEEPSGGITGDIDGDGKPDLVGAEFYGDIYILRNTSTPGNISFDPLIALGTEDSYTNLLLCDVNGDGKLDIVTSNYWNFQVVIFKNLSSPGVISFGPKITFAAGGYNDDIVAGDMDGDGKPDLAVANNVNGTVYLLHNNSTIATIAFSHTGTLSFGECGCYAPRYLALGELNGDNKPDLVYPNNDDNLIGISKNTGTAGSFSFTKDILTIPIGENQANQVNIADLDQDSKQDVFASIASGISFWRNTSTVDSFSFDAEQNYADFFFYTSCDLNGDGKVDLIGSSSEGFTVLQNNGNAGLISFIEKVIPDLSGFIAIDLDGDGKPDLTNGYSVFLNSMGNNTECNNPTGLAVSNISSTSAQLQWENNPTALHYKVQYKVAGTGDWNTLAKITSTTYLLSGLTPNTSYYWRTKSICSKEPKITSEWSAKQSFTTAPLRIGEQQTVTLILFPNPVADNFTINLPFTSLSNQAADIFLLNTFGQVVYSAHEIVGNGMLTKVITMPSTAASGWYVVRVVLSDQVVERKLLYQQ